MKRCFTCGEERPLGDFHRNRSKPDGLQAACKSCQREHARSWFARNPERVAGFKLSDRVKRYGITVEKYHAILATQGGRCAICGSPDPAGRGWTIDHDHACCPGSAESCGKCVRSILCGQCNLGLGAFKDNPQALRTAAEYLDKWLARPGAMSA